MQWFNQKDNIVHKVRTGEYTDRDVLSWSKQNDIVLHKNQLLLRMLADRNDFSSVRTMLKNAPLGGADIHTNEDYILRLFIREGNLEEARWLLLSKELGENAHINAKNYAAFLSACREDRPSAALFMLEFIDQADKNFKECVNEAFCVACEYGRPNMTRFLLENEALKIRPELSPKQKTKALLGAFRSSSEKVFEDMLDFLGGIDAFNHTILRSIMPTVSQSSNPNASFADVLKLTFIPQLICVVRLCRTPCFA